MRPRAADEGTRLPGGGRSAPPKSRRFCGSAMRHRTAGHARFDGEPCSPVSPFFLDRGLWLGESTSRRLCGVPGRIFASGEQKCFRAPAIFLWYRQAAPSLSKKEMVGPTVSASAACEKLPSPPAAGISLYTREALRGRPAAAKPPSPRRARDFFFPGDNKKALAKARALVGGRYRNRTCYLLYVKQAL